jgi:hypothetical protein
LENSLPESGTINCNKWLLKTTAKSGAVLQPKPCRSEQPMKIQKILVSLGLALTFAGCTTTSQHQDGVIPPKHANRVQIAFYDSSTRPQKDQLDIYDIKPPERPYKVIALLTCEGAPKEEAAMTTAIFYRARMIGADAVMSANTSFAQEGGGFIIGPRGGFGGGSSTRCVFRAKAIIYVDK